MAGQKSYFIGGLSAFSDVELNALPDAPVAGHPDIRLLLAPNGALRPSTFDIERCRPGETSPYLRIARITDGYFLQHVDGIDLEVTEGGHLVAITRLDPAIAPAHLEHLLLDQLLPLVFAQLGRLSFHGSAVEVEGRALCFLADSGTGKSTLAAALASHASAAFLADDHVVLEETPDAFVAHPSYASVRLWNASARALFDAEEKVGAKHRFGLKPCPAPSPVAAIALLSAGDVDQAEPLLVEVLRPRDGLAGVATHLDRLDPTDRIALARELDALARLTARTTIVRMRVARRLDRLVEVARAIRDWTGALG